MILQLKIYHRFIAQKSETQFPFSRCAVVQYYKIEGAGCRLSSTVKSLRQSPQQSWQRLRDIIFQFLRELEFRNSSELKAQLKRNTTKIIFTRFCHEFSSCPLRTKFRLKDTAKMEFVEKTKSGFHGVCLAMNWRTPWKSKFVRISVNDEVSFCGSYWIKACCT